MAIAALASWWVGVMAAIVSFVVLHRLAALPPATVTSTADLTASMLRSVLLAGAVVGQYVLPVLCFAGAAMSWWQRRQRRALANTVATASSASVLNDMTWQDFEKLVGQGFRLQGYQVAETGGGGADAGIDLRLTRDGERFIVQCKQWRALKVGVDVVREHDGAMAASGAAGGFVVTSGRFTDEAVAFAQGRNIRLVDGPRLHRLIQQASEHAPALATPVGVSGRPETGKVTCPTCAGPMVQREAKRGANAGKSFWGCRAYPACRGTRAG